MVRIMIGDWRENGIFMMVSVEYFWKKGIFEVFRVRNCACEFLMSREDCGIDAIQLFCSFLFQKVNFLQKL